MKTKRARLLSIFITALLVLQIVPLNWASAITPPDLTNTSYLKVHGTDYTPPGQRSSLTITTSGGDPISEASPGVYENIPAGAKISLDYAFHLEDGDGTVFYDYTGDEFFTAALPAGLDFTTASGIVAAHDTSGDYDYDLATWSISGSALTVELTTAAEDTTPNGGAENDAHQGKWGKRGYVSGSESGRQHRNSDQIRRSDHHHPPPAAAYGKHACQGRRIRCFRQHDHLEGDRDAAGRRSIYGLQ